MSTYLLGPAQMWMIFFLLGWIAVMYIVGVTQRNRADEDLRAEFNKALDAVTKELDDTAAELRQVRRAQYAHQLNHHSKKRSQLVNAEAARADEDEEGADG